MRAGMCYFDRTINLFTDIEFYRLFKYGSCESEGMKLPVFTARIHIRGQAGNKRGIDIPAHGGVVEIRIIHATDDRAEPERKKLPYQVDRIYFPDGKNTLQTHARQIFLA